MFWQFELGPWAGAQFSVLNIKRGSVLHFDCRNFMILMITESRFHKPFGISSNYRLIFPKVIYYRTPCLWCKTRLPGPAISASRIHPFLGRRHPVPIFGSCNHYDFGGFLSQWFEYFVNPGWNFEGGGFDNLCTCVLYDYYCMGFGALWYSYLCMEGYWGFPISLSCWFGVMLGKII